MNLTSTAKSSFRQIRSSGLVVLSIAAAMACSLIVISIAITYLFRPVPFARPSALVMAWLRLPGDDDPVSFSPGLFRDYTERQRSFESVAIFETLSFDIRGVTAPARIAALRASANLFDLLEVRPLTGRLFIHADELSGAPRVALLSASYWRSHYDGSVSAVGRTIELDQQPYQIIGVLPDTFTFPLVGLPENNIPANVVVPAAFSPDEAETRGAMFEYSVLGRLRPGVSLAQAQSDASNVVAQLHRDHITGNGDQTAQQPNAITLSGMEETVSASVRRPVQLLLITAALLLVIAGFNAATLLLVRGLQRSRQYAIQIALGAGRRNFLRQAIIESAVIAITASVLGLAAGTTGLYSLNLYLGEITPDWRTVPCAWWTVPLACLAYQAVLGGIIYKMSTVPLTAIGRRLFQEGDARVTGSRTMRVIQEICVSGQVALSVMLLLLSGILAKSLFNLRNADIGIATDHLYTATTALPLEAYPSAAKIRSFYNSTLDGIAALPRTTQAGLGTDLPLDATETETIHSVDGHSASEREHIPIVRTWTTGDYLGTLGVPLIAGRFFSTVDQQQSRPVVVVSASLAMHVWGRTDVLGREITVGPSTVLSVVGIVGDVKDATVRLDATPHVYTPLVQEKDAMLEHPTWNGLRRMSVVIRSSADPATLDSNVKRVIASLDAGLVVSDLTSVSSEIKRAALPESLMVIGTSGLASIAFALALIGAYSLASSAALQRQKEMGIRIALGAGRGNILALSARLAVRSSFFGIAAGVALALSSAHVLKSIAFGIPVNDPATYASVGICCLVAVVVAACVPAIRSSRTDPVRALKAI